MLYLYSSDAEPRYKRNVLEVLAYPRHHIMRFRYEEDIVSPSITRRGPAPTQLRETLRELGGRGLVIYAQITGSELLFFPIRFIDVIRLQQLGSVYVVDFRLAEFIDYSLDDDESSHRLSVFRQNVAKTPLYPLPVFDPDKGQTSTWIGEEIQRSSAKTPRAHQGYFLDVRDDPHATFPGGEAAIRAWESVVRLLVREAVTMRACMFYYIMGFYIVRRHFEWAIPPVGRHEMLLKSVSDGWTTTYPLPMARRVVLKIMFLRPLHSELLVPQTIQLNLEPGAFTGASARKIVVSSSYNEERVDLACARVFDSLLAPVSLELSGEDTAGPERLIAPAPTLLVQVRVPRVTVAIILFGLVFAPLLFGLSPDFLRDLGSGPTLTQAVPWLAKLMVSKAARLTEFAKLLAAAVALVAGFIGLRRLPMGK